MAKIDENLEGLGYSDRSKFIRDAIAEKLRRKGIEVPASIVASPSRVEKGGKSTHHPKPSGPVVYPKHQQSGAELNDVGDRGPKKKKP